MSTEEPPEYINLWHLIDFTGFHYDGSYSERELTILQPQLEALGYTDIHWMDGERDSFGPLTRVCTAKNSAGQTVLFIYG